MNLYLSFGDVLLSIVFAKIFFYDMCRASFILLIFGKHNFQTLHLSTSLYFYKYEKGIFQIFSIALVRSHKIISILQNQRENICLKVTRHCIFNQCFSILSWQHCDWLLFRMTSITPKFQGFIIFSNKNWLFYSDLIYIFNKT